MSGKFAKKKPRRKTKFRFGATEIMLVLVALLLVSLLGAMLTQLPGDSAKPTGTTTEPTPSQDETEPSATETRQPVESTGEPATESGLLPMDLGQGLIITDIAEYTGAYVEDGSDAVVSGVLMVILENTAEEALQYARITLYFGETPAEFTVSNLPAGGRVVLLEKNRASYVSDRPDRGELADVLFLPAFEMYADIFEIAGTKGNLTVKNISDTAVAGDIYVYYKNSAQDLFYGGITYRARVEGGLKPGESKQIIAAHYNPSGSTILMVTYTP